MQIAAGFRRERYPCWNGTLTGTILYHVTSAGAPDQNNPRTEKTRHAA